MQLFSFTYNLLGFVMLIWYAAIRWTIYADKAKFPWVYAPINMTTAFLSIVFLIPTLSTLGYLLADKTPLFYFYYWLSLFLTFRNMYYTVEDTWDLFKSSANPKVQIIYIAIDIAMMVCAAIWAIRCGILLG